MVMSRPRSANSKLWSHAPRRTFDRGNWARGHSSTEEELLAICSVILEEGDTFDKFYPPYDDLDAIPRVSIPQPQLAHEECFHELQAALDSRVDKLKIVIAGVPEKRARKRRAKVVEFTSIVEQLKQEVKTADDELGHIAETVQRRTQAAQMLAAAGIEVSPIPVDFEQLAKTTQNLIDDTPSIHSDRRRPAAERGKRLRDAPKMRMASSESLKIAYEVLAEFNSKDVWVTNLIAAEYLVRIYNGGDETYFEYWRNSMDRHFVALARDGLVIRQSAPQSGCYYKYQLNEKGWQVAQSKYGIKFGQTKRQPEPSELRLRVGEGVIK